MTGYRVKFAWFANDVEKVPVPCLESSWRAALDGV